MLTTREILYTIFNSLYKAYGPQKWWPADEPFEVMIGAILTQNTNWRNVERAIDNLKREGILDPYKLKDINHKKLASLIRPAGYFNIKARRIKAFVEFFIEQYSGSVEEMKKDPPRVIRERLLNVKGIGHETADSIILYALEHPVFVIDAYTKRILSRHNIIDGSYGYETYQRLFHENLQEDVQLYNEYHALLVKVGKEHCKAKPVCNGCPLSSLLP